MFMENKKWSVCLKMTSGTLQFNCTQEGLDEACYAMQSAKFYSFSDSSDAYFIDMSKCLFIKATVVKQREEKSVSPKNMQNQISKFLLY